MYLAIILLVVVSGIIFGQDDTSAGWIKYDKNPVLGGEQYEPDAIGYATSKDGLTGWQRHPENPVIRPGNAWDASAVYKPYAIFDGKRWLLWYNGRNGGVEQIGVAIHEGKNLGF